MPPIHLVTRRASHVRTAILFIGVSARIALAQVAPLVDPGAADQHTTDTRNYLDLQKRIEGEKKSDRSALSNSLAPPGESDQRGHEAGEAHAFVGKVVVDRSAILTEADLAAIVSPHEHREQTIADLEAIVNAINKLYAFRGYPTATAFLPPQTVADGIVRISLVEARFGAITVTGNRHTRTSYIRQQIAARPGELVQIKALEASLNRFNALHDLKLRAELRAGHEVGYTDLQITVNPESYQSLAASYDNAGIASMGRERMGLSESIGSLSGYQDPLTLGGYWSAGMWSLSSAYEFPLTADGLRFGPTASFNRVTIRGGAAQALGLTGTFYDVGARLSRGFVLGDDFVLTLYGAPHLQESTLHSQQIEVSHVPVRFLEAGGAFSSTDISGLWSTDLSVGAGNYHAAKVDGFGKIDLSASRFQRLPYGFAALLRASGQLKLADPQPLPPSQQFQIGGIATVRGYPEGSLIGDQGYAASAELDTPLPLGGATLFGVPLREGLRSAWFIDNGAVASAHRKHLTGAGGGLLMQLSGFVQTKLYVGTPLENKSDFKGVTLHFGVTATLKKGG